MGTCERACQMGPSVSSRILDTVWEILAASAERPVVSPVLILLASSLPVAATVWASAFACLTDW